MAVIPALIDGLVTIIAKLGYAGIFLGMTIESSFIPFPSEVVLPPAGVLVAQGTMSFAAVLAAAIAGSLAGAYINYFIGLHFGRRIVNALVNRYGKFLFLSTQTLDKADAYFKNHGSITTFTGRLLPAIRQLISIPAGFARMSLGKFTFYTALGSGIWSAILIYAGVLYGSNKQAVDGWLGNAAILVIILVIALILFYMYCKKRKSKVPSPPHYTKSNL